MPPYTYPWGMPPQMYGFAPPQQPSIEDKIKELELLDTYRKKLKQDIKDEKPEKKEEKPKKWHQELSPVTLGLFMLVTFPFWAIALVNAYSAAFKQLGVALKNVAG